MKKKLSFNLNPLLKVAVDNFSGQKDENSFSPGDS